MPADVVAELTGARLAFAERVLWDQLDLAVRAGEFIAVLDPNGTGKTSLLKVLLGQLPLTAGKVTICGTKIVIRITRAVTTMNGSMIRDRRMISMFATAAAM